MMKYSIRFLCVVCLHDTASKEAEEVALTEIANHPHYTTRMRLTTHFGPKSAQITDGRDEYMAHWANSLRKSAIRRVRMSVFSALMIVI